MLSEIIVSPSPHISGPLSTRRIMGDVIIGLMFPFLAAFYYFGFYAITLTATCVVSCVLTEYLCNLMRRRPKPSESLNDLSAVVTGIILAFSVTPSLPLWAAVIGSVFAIAIGKMAFGGLGSNIFNPAMAGRAFLTASFGFMMTTWTVPATIDSTMPVIGSETALKICKSCHDDTIPITQATPLDYSKKAIKSKSGAKEINKQLKAAFFGEVGGCLGETSTLMIILGGVYMLIRKTINLHTPLAVLIGTAFFALVVNIINPDAYMSPLLHLTSGGIMLCAFFIATDPVTAPLSIRGMWIFGLGVGAITMLIRVFGEYPGGVMYSVLLMNSVTPLIDRFCKLTPAGGKPNA